MTISRRTFVKGSLATTAVVAGGPGCGNDVSAAPIVEAEVVDDPTSARYGQIPVAVPMFPELAAVGGAVMLKLSNLPPGQRPFDVPERGVLLIHRGTPDDLPEFVATRADCPHQGCPLGYSAKDGLIECPCHGSRFRAVADASDPKLCVGLVLHPPSQDNLTVFAVKRVGDFVYVDLNSDKSCGVRDDFPAVVGGTITIPVEQYPAIGNVGGSIVGKPAGLDDKLIIARVATDQLIALSAVCTHRGCTVKLQADKAEMHCPCHDSAFAYDGTVLTSPATTPLKKYDVTFDGSVAVVTVAK